MLFIMKRRLFTEINGYNESMIRTMMKSIQTYYKNNNDDIHLFNFENFIGLSQGNINEVLVDSLGEMLDDGIEVNIERYNKLSIQIKEYCFNL
jgi:hypothetical protein